MNKEGFDFINAIGAMAESCGIFRESLITCGFTREEAVALVGIYVASLVNEAKDATMKKEGEK